MIAPETDLACRCADDAIDQDLFPESLQLNPRLSLYFNHAFTVLIVKGGAQF